LKTSSIPYIADHIKATIEEFKNSTSNITIQSPSLDDQDHSEEDSEYDDVIKKQQSNRDGNLQNSMEHEPLDLPSESSEVVSPHRSNSPEGKATAFSNMSTIQSEGCPPEIATPSSLLNLWAHVNDKNVPNNRSSKQMHDDSTLFTLEGEGDVSYQFTETLDVNKSPPKPTKDNHVDTQQPKGTPRRPQGTDHRHSTTDMPEFAISPINRGHSVPARAFATSKAGHLASPMSRPTSSNRPFSSNGTENKSHTTSKAERISPNRPTSNNRPFGSDLSENKKSTTVTAPDTSSKKVPPQRSSASSTTSNGKTSAPATSANNCPTPQKVSAEAFNNMKSKWTGGVSRRKSIVSSNSSVSGGANKEPLLQQYSSIRGIKQRSTLVVSKAVGGTLYGASVRQPSSGDSDTSSQVQSSPMKNRLYDDAFTQAKRREMLRLKADKEEQNRMAENVYRMPKASRKLTNNLTRKDDHLPVSDRLYKEAAEITIKKTRKSEQWAAQKENALTNWSCLQCGTYNDVKVAPLGGNIDQSNSVFTCSSCESTYDLYTIQESMFRPTNVSVMNGTMEDMSHRRSNLNGNIHEYLHANVYLETKKLQLLKEAWEDEDEVLTFKPVVPESSKQILRQYLINQKRQASFESEKSSPRQRNLNFDSTDFEKGDHSKIVVANSGLESYLTLPTLERLSKAETLCRMTKPGENDQQHHMKRSFSKCSSSGEVTSSNEKKTQLSESKLDDLFTRLTYEYVDRAAKRDSARNVMDNIDHTTGKKFFQPTIGTTPSTLCSSSPVFSSEKKESIYDKLLRKGSEAKERAKLLKDKVLKKEKADIDKNYSQPLEKSKAILKNSFDQCVLEIFKLLMANQFFFQEGSLLNGKGADEATAAPNNDMKMTAEYLNAVSEKLESFEGLSLDVRTIDPTLVLEDVQDLLSDLRELGIKNAEKAQANAESEKKDDESVYFVSFEQFRTMIQQCTAKRSGGVGRSYIFAPKPRDTAVRQMIDEESKEYTYRPTIDSKSDELARRKGRGEVPIDVILNGEAILREQRMQTTKSMLDLNENKECTFKPKLYAAPSHIIPTYRGQQREEIPTDSLNLDDSSDDEISVMTVSTCSTTVKPTTPMVGKNKVPVMRPNKRDDVVDNPSLKSLFPTASSSNGRLEKKSSSGDSTEVAGDKSDIGLRWARQSEAKH
jgi:hypothetical protein